MGCLFSTPQRRVRVQLPSQEAKTVQEDTYYQTEFNETVHHIPTGINSHLIKEKDGTYYTKENQIIYPYCQLNKYMIFSPPIGSGATRYKCYKSSTVYLCQDQTSKGVFAIKVIDRNHFFKFTYRLESMDNIFF